MTRDERINDYLRWLSSIAMANDISIDSYSKLLRRLFETRFRFSIPRDRNRVEDGIDLRWRYACLISDNDRERTAITRDLYLPSNSCNVLELMVALAIRCEESIMDDPRYGNRTRQWFWNMIKSLGLAGMVDSEYDEPLVDSVLNRFMDRRYEANGKGGLFTVRNCEGNLRTAEIWYQLCWYIDSINVD